LFCEPKPSKPTLLSLSSLYPNTKEALLVPSLRHSPNVDFETCHCKFKRNITSDKKRTLVGDEIAIAQSGNTVCHTVKQCNYKRRDALVCVLVVEKDKRKNKGSVTLPM